MNRDKRKILKGMLIAIIATLLFPPMATYHPMGGIVSWDGFGFLLSSHSRSTIMVSMLLTEWIAIAIIGAILWRLSSEDNLPATQALVGKIESDPRTRSAIRTALDKMKQ